MHVCVCVCVYGVGGGRNEMVKIHDRLFAVHRDAHGQING